LLHSLGWLGSPRDKWRSAFVVVLAACVGVSIFVTRPLILEPLSHPGVMVQAVADTYLDKQRPRRNAGNSRRLRVQRGPRRTALVRFRLPPGVAGAATLRIHLTDNHEGAMVVRRVTSRWTESGATWRRRPDLDPRPLGDVTTAAERGWLDVRLSSVPARKTVSLAIVSPTHGPAARISSSETRRAPKLIFDAPHPTPTPTPTPMGSQSPSPSTSPSDLPPVPASPSPTPSPSPSAEHLTWAPPALENPVTVEVTKENSFLELQAGRDYIIEMPDYGLEVSGGLWINGGRNVVLISGAIGIRDQGIAPTAESRRGLYLKGQTGVVHVEGVQFYGEDLSEGIQINAPRATVQLQNIRIEEIRARDQVNFSDNHPDLVQPWGGVRELRVDGLTGTTDLQGFFLRSDVQDSPIGSVTLRRVNVIGRRTHGYLFVAPDGFKSM